MANQVDRIQRHRARQLQQSLLPTKVRRQVRGLVLPVLGLLLASCALPPPGENLQQTQRLPTDAEVEQYNAQVEPDERIVCRSVVSVGTNIPKRKCYLVRELREVSRFHREQLRNVLR